MEEKMVRILYTNYKGVTAWRVIVPGQIRFGATEHHTDEQWLLEAHDVEKSAQRTFAMKDIQKWEV